MADEMLRIAGRGEDGTAKAIKTDNLGNMSVLTGSNIFQDSTNVNINPGDANARVIPLTNLVHNFLVISIVASNARKFTVYARSKGTYYRSGNTGVTKTLQKGSALDSQFSNIWVIPVPDKDIDVQIVNEEATAFNHAVTIRQSSSSGLVHELKQPLDIIATDIATVKADIAQLKIIKTSENDMLFMNDSKKVTLAQGATSYEVSLTEFAKFATKATNGKYGSWRFSLFTSTDIIAKLEIFGYLQGINTVSGAIVLYSSGSNITISRNVISGMEIGWNNTAQPNAWIVVPTLNGINQDIKLKLTFAALPSSVTLDIGIEAQL